jgi:hypothetical protein
MMRLPNSVWLDIISLVVSADLLQGSITGRGRTVGRGSVRYWRVPSWLRPIFAVCGLGFLAFAFFDFFQRFSN